MRTIWLLATLLTLPAMASDFSARYPVGSIQDRVQAQAALKDADSELGAIARNAKSRDADCLSGFLVNSCRDDVRREKELAEREVRRVRVEARDLQRQMDAQQSAGRRAAQAAERELKDAQRPKPPGVTSTPSDRARVEMRDASAAAKANAGPASEGVSPGVSTEPARAAQPRLTAAQRADNARKFEQKQLHAQERVRQQELERAERETRRLDKRKQVERREAEREVLRQKAAEQPR